MLFNSLSFIFGFLPAALLLFYLLGRVHRTAGVIFLTAASLGFYARWRPQDLWILGFAIVFNFLVGGVIQRLHAAGRLRAVRGVLAIGVVVDLGLLGYYKYANFVVDNLALATGRDITLHHIVLPLAISFFTFQKIAYLNDSARGEVRGTGFLEFSLFAAFFPQLLSGPIVHYSEIIPQLRGRMFTRFQARNLMIGLAIFSFGLFKKTVIADTLALYANPLFTHVASQHYDVARGWSASFSYMLQLYFDFSGYSDMAIGLARMFGVKLPLNFHSPLRAASIIDYWRRWHMSLQRFLLAYVYQPIAIPLNRWSAERGFGRWPGFAVTVGVPTFVTFLLSGIWHGAGWTFIVFGLLHALYVLTNQIWREIEKAARKRRRQAKLPPLEPGWLRILGYRLLTTFALGFTNVFFRATSVADGWTVSKAMLGLSGGIGSAFDGTAMSLDMALVVGVAALIVVLFPNTQQIMSAYRPATNYAEWRGVNHPPLMWRWRPTPFGFAFLAAVFFAGLMMVQRGEAVFLYFNF